MQGDEPTVDPKDVKKIINAKIRYPNHVICGYCDIKFMRRKNEES